MKRKYNPVVGREVNLNKVDEPPNAGPSSGKKAARQPAMARRAAVDDEDEDAVLVEKPPGRAGGLAVKEERVRCFL